MSGCRLPWSREIWLLTLTTTQVELLGQVNETFKKKVDRPCITAERRTLDSIIFLKNGIAVRDEKDKGYTVQEIVDDPRKQEEI